MGTEVVRRPARRPLPAIATEPITLAAPPVIGDGPPPVMGAPMLMMPIMSGGGAMVMVLSNLSRPLYATAGLLMLVASVAMGVVLFIALRSGPRRKLRQERERYQDYLEDARHTIREAVRAQRDFNAARHPHPGLLLGIACDPARRWERRATDADLLTVRCGLAETPLSRPLSLQLDPNPLAVYDPVCQSGAEELVERYATLGDQPLTVPIGRIGELSVVGDYGEARRTAQTLLAQLAALVAPEDLQIAVVAAPGVAAHWSGLAWLPHLLADGHNPDLPVPLICPSTAELAELLSGDLAVRAAELRRRRGAPPGPGARRLFVIVDGEQQVALPSLVPDVDPALLGVHLCTLVAEQRQEPEHTAARITVDGPEITVTTIDRSEGHAAESSRTGRADRIDAAELVAIARALSPHRLAPDDASHALSGVHGLTDILGVADPADIDWHAAWAPRPESELLRVPFAVDAEGQTVELDLKESALGGMGPHGLIVGATGSGKSETLRTLVAALAVRHLPERLALLTVDFKGGATFAECDALPHVAGSITNLADDLSLVDRFAEALYGEMARRQQLLKDAGNLPNVHTYAQLRQGDPALEPLPHLLVIIDEFSELLTAKPDFAELFVAVGRIGRSIGVHLLLATQRLEAQHLRGLESHLSYRIGLRTFSEGESREAIGVPDAYQLPPEPGSGYLKVDTTIFTRFKAAMVSGRYTPPRETEERRLPVLPWPLPPTVPTLALDALTSPTAEGPDTERSVLRVLVQSLASADVEPVRPVWLPPLPDALPLSAVPGAIDAAKPGGVVSAVLGLRDKPREQYQGPLEWELSGADANLMVVGAPASGKSTLVRTLVAGLALRYPPSAVVCYVIDYGGGALSSLAELPQVAVAAGRADPELVGRTLAEVKNLLDAREAAMRGGGIDSAAGLRRAAAAGRVAIPGDVVLAIDGWGALTEADDEAGDIVGEIAARGPALGVHVVLTAVNSTQVRARLAAAFSGRIELRLADAYDSGIDRKMIEQLPKDVPGRVVLSDKLFGHIALPRIDEGTGTDDLAAGFAGLAKTVSARWPGPRVAPVKALPAQVRLRDLVPDVPATSGDPYALAPVVGVAESDLGPAAVDFTADPHLIVFGDTQTGKSTVLRTIMRQIVRRPATETGVFLVDYRRTHLEAVPEDHLVTYCNTAAHAAQNAAELATALRQRLPGADVTPRQLRERSWWTGPEIFVVVDDYDIVAGSAAGNPLAPLAELVPQGLDLGFHLVIARRTGGASRALYEPLLRQVADMSSPGLLFSGDRLEGRLVNGAASRQLPVGRALLARRGQAPDLVQVAQS
ncbi:type VII secretion protein EccCa [Glycomyces sp. TRM65418]|uniref:type VII secretion protein EccCa n=1 Tax=Glycomyces sp. TRM65418 TaxID=2867006 RepID=UPI001CE5198C|nr:type VII secretion protein EccCa [Glycomyces sp. TRM65418]MCC3761600.1 type VII secretion protein EccCa [Glycomyces sp. TRM65418]QZD55696.1 type VII secretion protein EccCa [Glycomyces sp. TRM65418]